MIFGSSLVILFRISPLVLFQVFSFHPEADPASHPPFQLVRLLLVHGTHVVRLQHQQPLELGVLVDDAA